MTQAVVPRPVAWMLTRNADGSGNGNDEGGSGGGSFNLAPFSYFNALSSEPALVGVSFTAKPDGGTKDTLANVRRSGLFVAHIAPTGMLSAVNASSAGLPYGESEVSRLGLRTEAFGDFPLPRLSGCPVAFGCGLHREVRLGPAQVLVLGEIHLMFADDSVVVSGCERASGIGRGEDGSGGAAGGGELRGAGAFCEVGAAGVGGESGRKKKVLESG